MGHRHIKKQITLHRSSLETFGLLVAHETESTGGRPEEITSLNEQQATLLITFLKNTPVVVAFKTELVRQFYQMRTELQRRQMERERLRPIRRNMTDIIQGDPNHKAWDYKLYTDLAYKLVTGKNAAQIRKERGAAKKARAIDFMTAEEIERITELTDKIGVLLEMDMDYYQVKDILSKKYLKSA